MKDPSYYTCSVAIRCHECDKNEILVVRLSAGERFSVINWMPEGWLMIDGMTFCPDHTFELVVKTDEDKVRVHQINR